jgi:hypothetical protein
VRHVAAHDPGELVFRVLRMQHSEGIDGEGRAGALHLQEGEPQPRVAFDRRPAHGEAVLHPGIRLDLLVRRAVHRHQHHRVEPELVDRLLCAHEVPDVRRVERPAEDAEPRHAQPRT